MNDQRKTKKQLLQDLELERERSNALQEVSKRVAAAHETDEVLDLIVNEAARLVGASGGWIRVLEGDSLVLGGGTESSAGFTGEQAKFLPTGEASGVGRILAGKVPITREDASSSMGSLYPETFRLFKKHGIRGYAAIPLLANDRSIGVLILWDKNTRLFTEDEVSLLCAFADQAALALEKARMLNEAERERGRLAALNDVVSDLATTMDFEAVSRKITDSSRSLIGARISIIFQLDESTEILSLISLSGDSHPRFTQDFSLADPGTIRSLAARERQTLVMPDFLVDERLTHTPEQKNIVEQLELRAFVAVPFIVQDRVTGVLTVGDLTGRIFTDDEIRLTEAFADQASVALENARLLGEAEREKERSDALYRVSNLLAGAHDTDEVLDLIVNEAARLVGATGAYMRLLKGDGLEAVVATESAAALLAGNRRNRPSLQVEVGTSVSGHVMATKKPWVTEDCTKEDLVTPEGRRLNQELGIHGVAAVPLVANGSSIGVLFVVDKRIHRFTEDEVSLLSAFADQAALAFEKARLLNEAETEKERSDALYRVSNLLAGAHDTDEVLDLIVNEAARLLGTDFAFIRLLEGGVLVPSAGTDSVAGYLADSAESQPTLAVGVGASAMGHVMDSKNPLVFDDLSKEDLITPAGRLTQEKHGFKAGALIPLLANDRSIGVLVVFDKRVRHFTDNEVSLLTAFADQASLALEKARLLNEAEARERQAIQLYEVTTQLASNHDLNSVLDLITQQAVELTGGQGGVLFKYDVERGGLAVATMHKMGSEMAELFVLPGEGFAGRAFVERRAIWTDDLVGNVSELSALYADDNSKKIITEQYEEWGVVGIVAAPIIIRDDVYGVLDVVFNQHREFTNEEVNLVQNLADSAAVAINNARFIGETEKAREEAELREQEATQLQEITAQLASSTDMHSVLGLIAQKAVELLKPDGSGILRYDREKGGLVIAQGLDFLERLTPDILILPGEGTTGRAFQTRSVVWSGDPYHDGTFNYSDEATDKALRDLAPQSALSAPIIIRDEPYGVLVIIYYTPYEFSQRERQLLQTLADSAAVAIGNAGFIEEIQHRTAELDATNQELEAFSYSVSHDLRAPLRGIDGFSQALINEYSDVLDEQANHYLQRVRTGSQRMGQLIDDLLALSRVTRGEMRRENVDLSELARTVSTGLQERDPQRQAEFVIQDGVTVNGDTQLMRVALENLLGNAWKYTEKHQEARIEFGLTEDDGKRVCFIRDDGSGFDMAYADRLFGAFQRLHDQSEFEGSGIGLATVQRIIHRHGGQIWAEAAVEEGATFYFTLDPGDGKHG